MLGQRPPPATGQPLRQVRWSNASSSTDDLPAKAVPHRFDRLRVGAGDRIDEMLLVVHPHVREAKSIQSAVGAPSVGIQRRTRGDVPLDERLERRPISFRDQKESGLAATSGLLHPLLRFTAGKLEDLIYETSGGGTGNACPGSVDTIAVVALVGILDVLVVAVKLLLGFYVIVELFLLLLLLHGLRVFKDTLFCESLRILCMGIIPLLARLRRFA